VKGKLTITLYFLYYSNSFHSNQLAMVCWICCWSIAEISCFHFSKIFM